MMPHAHPSAARTRQHHRPPIPLILVTLTVLALVTCARFVSAAVPPAVRFIVNEAADKGAVCLDGSPPGFFLRKGYGSGADKWLLFFRPGGWCSSPSDCTDRSFSHWGSSEFFADTTGQKGILNPDRKANPDTYNWNVVIIAYCDGASFAGDVSEPMVVEYTTIYMRGRRILDFLMSHLLEKHGMKKGKQVLLSGCSAGAFAVLLHCDFLRRSALLPSMDVRCLADSGVFVDVPDVRGRHEVQETFKKVFELHNVSGSINPSCLASKSKEKQHECFTPWELLRYISTPIFIINSNYDIYTIRNFIAPEEADPTGALLADCANQRGKACSDKQMDQIQSLRSATIQTMAPLRHQPPSRGNGFFLSSCFMHCIVSDNERWNAMTVGNMTLMQAFGSWLRNGTSPHIDLVDCPYPCNKCSVSA